METGYKIILLCTMFIVLAELFLIYLLARWVGEFMKKLETVHLKAASTVIGKPAPVFHVLDNKENLVPFEKLYTRQRVLLLFAREGCEQCKEFLTELNKEGWAERGLNLVIIYNRDSETPAKQPDLIPAWAYYLVSSQMERHFQVNRYPFAISVNNQGLVEKGTPISDPEELLQLLGGEHPIAAS